MRIIYTHGTDKYGNEILIPVEEFEDEENEN